MKILSWSSTGIHEASSETNDLHKVIRQIKADFVCLNNIRIRKRVDSKEKTNSFSFADYMSPFSSFTGRNVGGVMIARRNTAVNLADYRKDIGIIRNVEGIDNGFIISVKTPNVWIVNVCAPIQFGESAKYGSPEYRGKRDAFDEALLAFVKELSKTLPVIICGDLFCVYNDDDLVDVKAMNIYGHKETERHNMKNFLDEGFVDVYLTLHPEEKNAYTWWDTEEDYRINRGGRLDYFIVSQELLPKINSISRFAGIRSSKGNIHCPLVLDIDI